MGPSSSENIEFYSQLFLPIISFSGHISSEDEKEIKLHDVKHNPKRYTTQLSLPGNNQPKFCIF
jgi:hypothetical protein